MKTKPFIEITGLNEFTVDETVLINAMSIFCEEIIKQSNVWISLMFCPSLTMKEVNLKYRGVNQTTDVLSFPSEQVNPTSKSDCNESHYLGEILIDINYVSSQTESKHLHYTIVKTFVHGLLHLAGYDHLQTKQKVIMQEVEEYIMNKLNMER